MAGDNSGSMTEFFRRLEVISDRINTISLSIATQSERERYLVQDVAEMNKTIDKIDGRLKEIEKSALKTAGGFAVLVALGVMVGYIMSSLGGIVAFIRGLK